MVICHFHLLSEDFRRQGAKPILTFEEAAAREGYLRFYINGVALGKACT
jgi:hypothetical protein